jgi:hypothetical protein
MKFLLVAHHLGMNPGFRFGTTVKLGDKERFDKEQIGVKELFTDYQPIYTINLLLDKELLPIKKIPKLGVSEHKIVKISKKSYD